MTEKWNCDEYTVVKERLLPVSVVDCQFVANEQRALKDYAPCITFHNNNFIEFKKSGAWILLDFGREVCGGIRVLTSFWPHNSAKFRITFGESASEACAVLGEKGAENDHSPRDFTADIYQWSDLAYGQTGFRFVRLELLEEKPSSIQNIYAVNTLPCFEQEAVIKTSDEALNNIINTAAYTLKLCCQNGYIWDGIKRDRLVWSGDLHPEVRTSLYLFGNNKNVTNSLSFLKKDTDPECWMNHIPSYSAWWVVNFCDYCFFTGNDEYFNLNKEYAKAILKHLDSSVTNSGEMHFGKDHVFFLDWPTHETKDAEIGTAMIISLAAQKFLNFEEDESCKSLMKKLQHYLAANTEHKQARALQILAGRQAAGDKEFLEAGLAKGYSTFMAYYILTAYAKCGGTQSLNIIKEYFGGMLARGATTFWEDFDLDWLNGSGRIDRLPLPGKRDLHGDYGKHCYIGFRHSLCHGWSSGVLAFIVESVFGIRITKGCKKIKICPNAAGLSFFEVNLPLPLGGLYVKYEDGRLAYTAPDGVEVCTEK